MSDSNTPTQPIDTKKTCQAATCTGKPSTMQCPICHKNGLTPAYFCSQECYRSEWPKHKILHPRTTKAAATTTTTEVNGVAGTSSSNGDINTNPWPNYRYSGNLRPYYPLSSKRHVPSAIPHPEYAQTGTPFSEQTRQAQIPQVTSSPKDLENLRRACALARKVLDTTAAAIRPGITTDELDQICHDTTIRYGAYPSPLNYHGFPKSCCTSINEVICHGIPDQRPLEDGDIINIDVTVYYKGFHGDLNETYAVGESVDENGLALIEAARNSMEKAIAACKPGFRYRDVGEIIEKSVKACGRGFSVVRTYCGHGVGKMFHCAPNVPHYAKNKAVGTMRPGHVFTIEPMINEGAWADARWPDQWTAVTVDGKRSAQFEQTLLITDKGVEVLTAKGTDLKYNFDEVLLNDADNAEKR